MVTVASYDERELYVEEMTPKTCRVMVVDEQGCGSIHISRNDAKALIKEMERFLSTEKW